MDDTQRNSAFGFYLVLTPSPARPPNYSQPEILTIPTIPFRNIHEAKKRVLQFDQQPNNLPSHEREADQKTALSQHLEVCKEGQQVAQLDSEATEGKLC